MISLKTDAARVTNLTQKCSTMSHRKLFILGSKGQSQEAQKQVYVGL